MLKLATEISSNSRKGKINTMNFNLKQIFFIKLRRKIWRLSMHLKHKSLIFVGVKNYPTNSYMFEVDIRNTRTRCEICSKLTINIPGFFSTADFQHVFVFRIVTFIFIVRMICIIVIIFIVLIICRKIGIWCTF